MVGASPYPAPSGRSVAGGLWRYGVILFGGYLAFFLLRHAPYPRAVPGLLALAPAGYLQLAATFNPAYQLIRMMHGPAALYSAALGLLLALLFLAYFGALRVAWHRDAEARGWMPIVVGAALFSLPLLCTPYLLSRDIYSYVIYGRIAAIYGGNPALTPPIAYAQDMALPYLVAWRDTPSVYGPLWTLLSHGLTLAVEGLGGGMWRYVLAYKLAMLLAHLLNSMLIWLILTPWRPERRLFGTLLYAWNPLVLLEFVESAHNDVLMLSLVLLAILCAQRGGWRRAIVALAGAALIKWIAALLLPLWLIVWLSRQPTWGRRLLLAGQALGLALLLALAAQLPYGQVAHSLAAPLALQAAMKPENSLAALALGALHKLAALLGLGTARANLWRADAAVALAWGSKLLALLAWLAALVLLWRRPTFERMLELSCGLLVALLLVSPVFRTWYAIWPLALAALLEWRPYGRVATIFAASAWLVHLGSGAQSWSDILVFVPVIIVISAEIGHARQEWRARLAAALATSPIARMRGGWSRGRLG